MYDQRNLFWCEFDICIPQGCHHRSNILRRFQRLQKGFTYHCHGQAPCLRDAPITTYFYLFRFTETWTSYNYKLLNQCLVSNISLMQPHLTDLISFLHYLGDFTVTFCSLTLVGTCSCPKILLEAKMENFHNVDPQKCLLNVF